jgi:hypothetical protein
MPVAEAYRGEKRETVSDRNGRVPIGPLLIIAALLLLLTNIPLIYGYLTQPPDFVFMGIVAGVRDSNVYFMMMEQGDSWSPIIENLFRPGEPNEIYHGVFWFLLGKLAYSFGISKLVAFHMARAAATIMFVPAIYAFTVRFLDSRAARLTASAVICFGAGAGWLLVIVFRFFGVLPIYPSDIATPEASAFYTLMTFPHLSFTLIMVFLCMMFTWDAIDSGKIKPAFWAGLCALIVGFVHAFNLVVACFALALFMAASLFIRRDRSPFRAIVTVACFAVWPILYYAYIMLAKPGLLPVGAVRSPPPLDYLVGFGPLVVGCVVRVSSLFRARELPKSDLFLLCWIAATCVMLYSYPLLSQEARAVLGLQLPLAVLAVRAVFLDVLPALRIDWEEDGAPQRTRLAALVVSLLVVITLPSTFYNIMDRSQRLRDYPELFSLTVDEHQALEFLQTIGGRDIVLSGERIGSYIPRVANKRAWMGQYNYPSYNRRMKGIKEFFAETTLDAQRFELLRDNNIRFVFHGDHERSLGGFRPQNTDYLHPVFENATVSIYNTATGAE